MHAPTDSDTNAEVARLAALLDEPTVVIEDREKVPTKMLSEMAAGNVPEEWPRFTNGELFPIRGLWFMKIGQTEEGHLRLHVKEQTGRGAAMGTDAGPKQGQTVNLKGYLFTVKGLEAEGSLVILLEGQGPGPSLLRRVANGARNRKNLDRGRHYASKFAGSNKRRAAH